MCAVCLSLDKAFCSHACGDRVLEKGEEPFLGCPYNQDDNILKSVVGFPLDGNCLDSKSIAQRVQHSVAQLRGC